MNGEDELAGTEGMPDLELLAKLASGEGGRRTGLLKRLGYLVWTVTPQGMAALDEAAKAKSPQ